jgi:hypothetical protein
VNELANAETTGDAAVLTKPPYFGYLEFDFEDCWERLGKELKVSNTK